MSDFGKFKASAQYAPQAQASHVIALSYTIDSNSSAATCGPPPGLQVLNYLSGFEEHCWDVAIEMVARHSL